jgi:hypothetical protein
MPFSQTFRQKTIETIENLKYYIYLFCQLYVVTLFVLFTSSARDLTLSTVDNDKYAESITET